MASIGRRDQLVTLERATTVKNEHDEEVPAWSPLGQEWAAVFYGRGDERRQAAMEQGRQPATFQVLSNPLTSALTVSGRVQFGGAWDIIGIAPEVPQRGYIEITAIRSAS